MNWKEKIEVWFDNHENEGVELLAELIRTDTINPPGNEYRAAKVVEKFLKKYNIDSKCYEAESGRTNLLAKIGKGNPVVFVPAHTDVVPVGDGWNTNPLEPVIKDGFMYGRGTTDNKGSLASVLLLAAFLKKHENEFNGTFFVGAVADEECGSEKGITYLFNNNLIEADFAIVPDTGTSIYSISRGEKGLLHVEIIFNGKQAHGSSPELGLNSIWAAIDFLNLIQGMFGKEIGYLDESPTELFSPTSINIGSIKAGSSFNIVPATCSVKLDIRFTLEHTGEKILALVEETAEKVKQKGACNSYEIKIESEMKPFEISKDNPLVDATESAVKELTGKSVKHFGISGTTVCKQLLENDIPVIGFSQEGNELFHQANERISLSEIPLFGKALGLTFLKLVNEKNCQSDTQNK